MDINLILGILVAGLVVVYLIKALSRPIAGIGKILMRSALAFCAIWAVNVIGSYMGFHMGLNLISAVTVGALGVPGIALLLAIKYLV